MEGPTHPIDLSLPELNCYVACSTLHFLAHKPVQIAYSAKGICHPALPWHGRGVCSGHIADSVTLSHPHIDETESDTSYLSTFEAGLGVEGDDVCISAFVTRS
jgi:hypothetical protein